jgi:hypothetical protein
LNACSSNIRGGGCVRITLRRIAANNFRKFRAPVTIDRLTERLNIVAEPKD